MSDEKKFPADRSDSDQPEDSTSGDHHEAPTFPPGKSKPASDDHPDHGLQELSFDDVVKVYNDPNTKLGVNIFVDARRDDQFEQGHIPGAILCNPFQLEDYIELVLDFAEGAEKIIVYCNGGDCEDSISLCGELLEFDVPYESIFLYAAGWKAWKAGNMPVETGMGGE